MDWPQDLTADLCAQLAPPREPRTYLEFARSMRFPDGPRKGDLWDPETEPVQFVWVRHLDQRGRWRKHTRVAPSQRGKSLEAIALPTLYTLIELDQNASYLMPTLDAIGKNWSTKIIPFLRDSGYGHFFPISGPGSKDGRPVSLTLRDPANQRRKGTLYPMAAGGGGKETSKSSITSMLSAFDEADDSENDGDLKLGEKRTAAFGDKGAVFVASTVNDRKGRDGHPVLSHHGLGSRTTVHFQCPHCAGKGPTAGFQLLIKKNLHVILNESVAEAKRSIRYACEHCGVMWDEADRQRALNNYREVHAGQSIDPAGNVIGPEPETDHYSLLSSDLDYRLASLPRIAEDWWAAQNAIDLRGDHSLMRVFSYKVFCEEYTGDQTNEDNVPSKITIGYMIGRSAQSDYELRPREQEREDGGDSIHVANCPPWVEALTVTADVQKGGVKAPPRLYFLVHGVDSGFRTADLAWGTLSMGLVGSHANTSQLHLGLDKLKSFAAALAADYSRTVAYRGVDVGDRQDEIRQWLIRNPDWLPIKGQGYTNLKAADYWDLDGWIVRRRQDNAWWLYFVDVNQVRYQAQAQFLMPLGKPGAAHLPRGLTASSFLIKHYCSTALITDGRGGTRWAEPKAADRQLHPDVYHRRDWLDCRTYGLALSYKWVRELEKRKKREAHPAPANEPAPLAGEGDRW